ncbi:MAG: hypothetical protein WKF29_08665 [Thermoleophilaceae bacterium]
MESDDVQERIHALETAQATQAASAAGVEATQAATTAGMQATQAATTTGLQAAQTAAQAGTWAVMTVGSVALIVGIFLGLAISNAND